MGKSINNKFKIGEKIVDYNQVYRIFKIQNKKIFDGKKLKHLFYKPFYSKNNSQSLVCSIPEKNVAIAQLRRPASSKKIKEVLKTLSKTPNNEDAINTNSAESLFKENSPFDKALLLKLLWIEMQDKEKALSRNIRQIYDKALTSLSEEVAIVQKIKLKTAQEKIIKRLKHLT